MTAVTRLVTWADLADGGYPGTTSASARLAAELVDGRSIVLLDGRGWTTSGEWAGTSVEETKETARAVVGPDEGVEASRWAFLCEALRREGVVADPDELRRLPHDVVLGDRLRARVS